MKFRSIAALAAVSGLSACVVAPEPGVYAPVVVPVAQPATVGVPPPPPVVPVIPVVPVDPVPAIPPLPVVEPVVTNGIWLPPAVVIHDEHPWHGYGLRRDGPLARERFGPGPVRTPLH